MAVPSTVAATLVDTPSVLVDDIPLGRLRHLRAMDAVLEAAGLTLHYWRPSPPGSLDEYVEVIAEHAESGVWVAKRVEAKPVTSLSSAVSLLDGFLDTGIYPAAGSLPALAHALATTALLPFGPEHLGRGWTTGGLLLGCLRLLDDTDADSLTGNPEHAAATRTLLGLLDESLLPEVDRLACWQDSVSVHRNVNEYDAREAYFDAVLALWPTDGGAAGETVGADVGGFVNETVADQISRSTDTDYLLSLPRAAWPTAAPQIILRLLANHEKWVFTYLKDAWEKAGNGEFTSPAALDAAAPAVARMAGVSVPAPKFP